MWTMQRLRIRAGAYPTCSLGGGDVGAGTNGIAQAAGFNDQSTGEGATSMGFYNMSQGDAPYTKYLADSYAMSDNYHQPAKGGTD